MITSTPPWYSCFQTKTLCHTPVQGIRTTDPAKLLGETTSRCYSSSIRVNTLLTPHGCSSFPVSPPSLFDPSSVFFDSLSPRAYWFFRQPSSVISPTQLSFLIIDQGKAVLPNRGRRAQRLPVFWVRVFSLTPLHSTQTRRCYRVHL